MKERVDRELGDGEIVRPEERVPNPWLAIAGTWKDRPDLDEFEENIRDYRRQVDADPDRP